MKRVRAARVNAHHSFHETGEAVDQEPRPRPSATRFSVSHLASFDIKPWEMRSEQTLIRTPPFAVHVMGVYVPRPERYLTN
jgi:hypothetical protein